VAAPAVLYRLSYEARVAVAAAIACIYSKQQTILIAENEEQAFHLSPLRGHDMEPME